MIAAKAMESKYDARTFWSKIWNENMDSDGQLGDGTFLYILNATISA